MPSLSTVSWKYTQEKWLPSSRDLQKAWTGLKRQSDAEMDDAIAAALSGAGAAGGQGGGLRFLPLLLLLSHQMGTTGREGVIFFSVCGLTQLAGMLILAVSSSKQIGKPAVLHVSGLSARHTTYLGYAIGNRQPQLPRLAQAPTAITPSPRGILGIPLSLYCWN